MSIACADQVSAWLDDSYISLSDMGLCRLRVLIRSWLEKYTSSLCYPLGVSAWLDDSYISLSDMGLCRWRVLIRSWLEKYTSSLCYPLGVLSVRSFACADQITACSDNASHSQIWGNITFSSMGLCRLRVLIRSVRG